MISVKAKEHHEDAKPTPPAAVTGLRLNLRKFSVVGVAAGEAARLAIQKMLHTGDHERPKGMSYIRSSILRASNTGVQIDMGSGVETSRAHVNRTRTKNAGPRSAQPRNLHGSERTTSDCLEAPSIMAASSRDSEGGGARRGGFFHCFHGRAGRRQSNPETGRGGCFGGADRRRAGAGRVVPLPSSLDTSKNGRRPVEAENKTAAAAAEVSRGVPQSAPSGGPILTATTGVTMNGSANRAGGVAAS